MNYKRYALNFINVFFIYERNHYITDPATADCSEPTRFTYTKIRIPVPAFSFFGLYNILVALRDKK